MSSRNDEFVNMRVHFKVNKVLFGKHINIFDSLKKSTGFEIHIRKHKNGYMLVIIFMHKD